MKLKALLKAFQRVMVLLVAAGGTGASLVFPGHWAAAGTLLGLSAMFYQTNNILIFLLNDEPPYLTREWKKCVLYITGIDVCTFLAGMALLSGYILLWLLLLLPLGYLLVKLLMIMRTKWEGHFTFRR